MAAGMMPLGVTAVMLPELDFDEQIQLCRRAGVSHYCARPRIIPDEQRGKPWGNWGNHKFDLTPQRLAKEAEQIRRKLEDAGLVPFGTVPVVTITDADDLVKLNLEGAAKLNAGRMRVAPTRYPQEHFDYGAELQKQIDGFGRIVELARPHKIKVVIETHCRSIATSPALALNICRHFDPDDLGVIFDIANFNIEGMLQPNLAVAVLDRYIDHCHVGGSRLQTGDYDELGFRKAGCSMCQVTEANLHIPAWIRALHAAGRHVPLLIEDYTPNKPGAWRLEDSATALKRILATL